MSVSVRVDRRSKDTDTLVILHPTTVLAEWVGGLRSAPEMPVGCVSWPCRFVDMAGKWCSDSNWIYFRLMVVDILV